MRSTKTASAPSLRRHQCGAFPKRKLPQVDVARAGWHCQVTRTVACDPCVQRACRLRLGPRVQRSDRNHLGHPVGAGVVVLGYERDSSLQLTSRATMHSGLACQGPFVIISTTHSSLRTVCSSPWPEFADVCRASVLLGRSKLRGATWRGRYLRSGGWQ